MGLYQSRWNLQDIPNGGKIRNVATTATYDAQDRLRTYNALTFTYNNAGDLLSKRNTTTNQTTSYEYDVFGNLRKVTLPNATVIEYEVDAMNRRIGKKVGGVLQVRYLYQDQLRIAAELNANGTLKRRYVYGTKSNVPDYFVEGSQKYRIISDHLGSPRQVIRLSDGLIVHEMDHDEFGRVVKNAPAGYLPFGYAGGLYDAQTGLVRFGARDYDPEIGRWTSKDPILFEGDSASLYAYVDNDPINWIDENGLNRNRPYQSPSNSDGPGLSGGPLPPGGVGGSNGRGGGSGSGGGTGKPGAPAGPSGGSFCSNYSPKIQSQMKERGWTPQMISEAVKTQGVPATGKLGPATRYVHPGTGQSVVIDNKTGAVFHIGKPGYKY